MVYGLVSGRCIAILLCLLWSFTLLDEQVLSVSSEFVVSSCFFWQLPAAKLDGAKLVRCLLVALESSWFSRQLSLAEPSLWKTRMS